MISALHLTSHDFEWPIFIKHITKEPLPLMIRIIYVSIVLYFVILPWNVACTDLTEYDRERIRDAVSDSFLYTTESWNIEMSLIEDGRRRVRVTSPYAATITRDNRTETELGKPVHVTVLDSTGAVETRVTSQSAKYTGHRSEFQFRNDVIVQTHENRKLMTDYLEWSQKERRINSPDFVIIVTETDSITGYGLEGSDDLSTYSLSRVTGEFELENNVP